MRRTTRICRSSQALAALLWCAIGSLGAQAPLTGFVTGVVSDSSGAPITGAEISLVGSPTTVRSDNRGHFRLPAPMGVVTVSARRLGFELAVEQVQINGSIEPTHVGIRLRSLPMVLKPVVVKTARVDYAGRLAGYYRRLESQSGGYFISRAEIDRENPRMLSQLLSHVPAVNATRLRSGGGGVRMRGRNCWPLVWLDGLPMGAGEVDLDAFPVNTIQGIELYLGSTTAPMKYLGMRDQSSCGTILLWSRGPDTDPPERPGPPKVDLERMIASLKVYMPDQVDEPAIQDSAHSISVDYPAPLFAAGVGGAVTAEFVVAADGKVEEGTFGVVSSTDPLLSDAVKRAVERATFKPAKILGRPVRQLVMQPFAFPAREKKIRRG